MLARWFFYIPVFAELLPPVAVIRSPSRSRARVGIAVWAVVLFITDALSWWQGHILHRNNLWLEYLCTAISGAILLGALSAWQIHSVPQLAFRVVIPLYLLAHIVLVTAVEDLGNFSVFTDTLNGLLLLILVLYTLISHSLEASEHLTHFDWFWVCSGLALYFSGIIAYGPISRLLIGDRPDLLWAVLEVRAVGDTIAMFAIARGLLCPMPSPRSGMSSSLRSSRSSSYS